MIRPLLVFLDLRNYLTAKHLADGLECLPSMAKALSNTQYLGVGELPQPGVVAQYFTLSTGEAEAGRLVV